MTLSVYSTGWWVWLRILVGLAFFSAGWTVNGWRAGAELAAIRQEHAEVLRDIADKTTETVRAVARASQAANAAITAADQKSIERIAQNEEETNRLRACVRDGTCGVRIITKSAVCSSVGSGPADSSTGGVGNAAIELDPEAGQRVLDLRASVWLDAEKLEYLRAYAESCWRAGPDSMKVVKEMP